MSRYQVLSLPNFLAVRLDARRLIYPQFTVVRTVRARALLLPALEIVLKNC